MNECLLDVLRKSTNNTDIAKVGELRFNVVGTGSKVFSVCAKKAQVASIVNEIGYFVSNNQRTINIPSNQSTVNLKTTEAGSHISVPDKYNVTELKVSSTVADFVDIEDLVSSVSLATLIYDGVLPTDILGTLINLTHLNATNFSGDLAELSPLTKLMDNLTLRGSVYGNISGIANNVNIPYIDIENMRNITGDIFSLENCIKLSKLFIKKSGVGGEITSLCQKMISHSRDVANYPKLTITPSATTTLLNSAVTSSVVYVTFNSSTSISIGTTDGGSDLATGTYSGGSWTWS